MSIGVIFKLQYGLNVVIGIVVLGFVIRLWSCGFVDSVVNYII